jgi:hypothetical protein
VPDVFPLDFLSLFHAALNTCACPWLASSVPEEEDDSFALNPLQNPGNI